MAKPKYTLMGMEGNRTPILLKELDTTRKGRAERQAKELEAEMRKSSFWPSDVHVVAVAKVAQVQR